MDRGFFVVAISFSFVVFFFFCGMVAAYSASSSWDDLDQAGGPLRPNSQILNSRVDPKLMTMTTPEQSCLT